MSLRPFAPLAVIGAGLLLMSVATRPATADSGGAPGAVDVASVQGGLVVTWTAPVDRDGLREYDLLAVDPDSGQPVLGRTLDAGTTRATIDSTELAGLHELSISVTSAYADGAHAPGPSVRVLLAQGPTKPEVAPAVRIEGRQLQVALPDAPDGVTGRVVQLYQDGVEWSVVSVAAGKALVTREVPAGHRYRAAYQDVNASAAGSLSERSGSVRATADPGPSAVRRIRLVATPDGLQVRWSAAAPQGADVAEYRVRLYKDGTRIGRVVTASDARSAVLSASSGGGVYDAVVVAVDTAGGRSASTVSMAPAS